MHGSDVRNRELSVRSWCGGARSAQTQEGQTDRGGDPRRKERWRKFSSGILGSSASRSSLHDSLKAARAHLGDSEGLAEGVRMADIENYSSLQEFTEELTARGDKPILRSAHARAGVVKGMECLRGQMAAVLLVALLASICANIVLGVLLMNSRSAGTSISDSTAGSGREAASLTLKLTALQERFSVLCSEYTNLGSRCSSPVRTCRPCPEGWTHLQGKCYYFSEDKLDWKSSRDSCASMGSHLIILHTHQQHDDLGRVARTFGGFDYHYWIGLTDTEQEGVWKWVDNTVVNQTYWNNKEPDNHLSGGLHGEDCAVLDSHSTSWFDVPCEFLYKRICEMDAVPVQ